MPLDAPLAGLVALAAFDAGVYFHAARGAKGELERIAEPVVFLGTAVALLFALLLGGAGGAILAVVTLWSRAGWDGLHLGDGNVLQIALAPDYALYSLIVKAAATALFLLFAFPG